jgi:hypothetical protein
MWWIFKAGETLHNFIFPTEEPRRDEGAEYKELWRIKCGTLPEEATCCWSSNDYELYCSTTDKVFRLIFEPAGIEECQTPPFKGVIKSLKAIGDRLFLLFDHGELAYWLRSPENPSCYILQWGQKIDNVCRIKDALIRKNILCIESDPTLVFLDIMTGEIIHKLPLTYVANWDFYGSYLVTFDSRYIHFYHLRTGALSTLDIHERLASKGCIKWAKIQQDDGTIFLDVEQLDIHKLYKLSPSQLKLT